MAERPALNLVSIVANIGRTSQNDRDMAAAEVAVDVLRFIERECEELGASPGPAAHLVILDLAAALIAFNGVRNVDDLVSWLREELPARAKELAKAVSASVKLDELPPCSCRGTPEPASWH